MTSWVLIAVVTVLYLAQAGFYVAARNWPGVAVMVGYSLANVGLIYGLGGVR